MSAPSKPVRTNLSFFDRLLIVLGFVLTTYFTFVLQDRTAECQTIRTQRLADVDRFRTYAQDFEPLVDAYMGDALRSKNDAASKKAVLLNLRNQRARLAYVVPYLDSDGKAAAQRLSTSIENFVVEAESAPSGTELGPLYQELSYIFSASQDMLVASNRATGMDAIKITSGRFWKQTLSCSESS